MLAGSATFSCCIGRASLCRSVRARRPLDPVIYAHMDGAAVRRSIPRRSDRDACGSDGDVEFDAERAGEAGEGVEGRVVLAGFETGDGGLLHSE